MLQRVFSHRFNKNMYDLNIGEYLATSEKEVLISTVLGPCVAVCLVDKVTGMAGMNHFMMPGASGGQDARYGHDSMERLLEEMMRGGASEKRLEAKVFGGAVMFRKAQESVPGNGNVSFIEEYLDLRKIPIQAKDTGNYYGRRIYYCTSTYSVWLKKFQRDPESSMCSFGGLEKY